MIHMKIKNINIIQMTIKIFMTKMINYIDKKLIDSYKNMHITYAEITLNYEPNIHYVV